MIFQSRRLISLNGCVWFQSNRNNWAFQQNAAAVVFFAEYEMLDTGSGMLGAGC